jgi:hypothetical protein
MRRIVRGAGAGTSGLLALLGLLHVCGATLAVASVWPRRGALALATLFGPRAIGEFRYLGLFTPLCVVIALGSAVTAAGRSVD